MAWKPVIQRDCRDATGDSRPIGRNLLQNSTVLGSGCIPKSFGAARKRTVRKAPEVEPLEPRILLSADLAPFAVSMLADQNDLTLGYDDSTDLIQIHDTFTGELVAEQLRAETSAIQIDGTDGDDRLVMDMAGSYIFPGGVFFDAGEGSDEVAGPDFDSTWIIDGIGAGSVNGMGFADVETVTGGKNNDDVFRLLSGGQMTDKIEGGDGGFDTLEVVGNGASAVTYVGTTGDSGEITLDGLLSVYDGFEPTDLTNMATVAIVLGPGENGDTTGGSVDNEADLLVTNTTGTDTFLLQDPDTVSPSFEEVSFGDASLTSVSIDMGSGVDTLTISGLGDTDLDGKLSIDLGIGDDKLILDDDYGALLVDGGGGTDTVELIGDDPAVLAGGVITTTFADQATLTEIDLITGDNLALDLDELRNAVNEAFDKVLEIYEAAVGGANAIADLTDTLPLISGSSLSDKVDVTLAKMAAFAETLNDVKFRANTEFDALVEAGNTTVGDIRDALSGITDAASDYLGPGFVPFITGVEDAIATALGSSGTFGFEFELLNEFEDDVTGAIAVTVADVNAIANGTDLEKLATALNAKLVEQDLSDQLQAVAHEGRLAFNVLGQDVATFKIKGAAGLAQTVLGYSSAFDVVDDIKGRLTALGENLIDISGVDLELLDEDSYSLELTLETSRTSDFGLEFGLGAAEQGLEFDSTAKLSTTFALLADLDLLLELGTLGDPGDESFAGSATLGAGFGIDGTFSGDLDAGFGFVAVTGSGTVTADAGLLMSAAAGISSGTNANTFVGSATFDVVGYDVSAMAFEGVGDDGAVVDLAFVAKVGPGGTTLIGGTLDVDATITNVFDDPDPTFTFDAALNSDFEGLDLSNLSNLSATEVVQAISELVLWARDLTNSPLISGIDIPLVEGALDDLLNFSGILSNAFLYDVGSDGVRDGAETIVSDINSGLASAGLEKYLRAEVDADSNGAILGFRLVVVDPEVDDVEISTGTVEGVLYNFLSALGGGGTTTFDTALSFASAGFLSTMLSDGLGELRARFIVNFKDSNRDPDKGDFTISNEEIDNNTRVGDDLSKLVDVFGAPTFSSATDLAQRLQDIGLLPSAGDFAFDPATEQLTYRISISDEPIFDLELDTDFEIDLDPILNVQSNSRLVLSGDGSVDFTLGFDLSDGDLPGDSTLVEGTTLLSDLGIEVGKRLKTAPAVTFGEDPASIKGRLAADAGFKVSVNGGSAVTVTVQAGATADNTTASHLIADINAALTAAGVTQIEAELFTDPGNSAVEYVQFVPAPSASVTSLSIEVAAGDPALSAFGLQPEQSFEAGDPAVLRGTTSLPKYVGVLENDATFDLTTGGDTWTVTVLAENTFVFDDKGTTDEADDVVKGLNRNIIDLVADVETALENATGGPADTNLADLIDVGFQGGRLVLTAADGTSSFTVSPDANASDLGLAASADSNGNDLILKVDGAPDIAISFDSVPTNGTATIQDILNIFNAEPGVTVEITPEDPATPEPEGGKSLRLTYTGSGNLVSVEATNGSGLAAALGLAGFDQNPLVASDPDDDVIQGAPIGGIRLVDRFFVRDSDTTDSVNDLASVFGLDFEARLGRVVDDIVVVSDTEISSDRVDLREFVGDRIVIRSTNGLAAGTYAIDSAAGSGDGPITATISLVGGGTTDVGEAQQSGGFGVINTGVDAGASLGFIDVALTSAASGAPLFGAEVALGFNTNNTAPAGNGILTLGEIIEAFARRDDDDDTSFTDRLLTIIAPPTIEIDDGIDTDNFGGVDVTLDVSAGSADFTAIAQTLLGGVDPNFSLDILALGDPFLGIKFDNANAALSGGDTIALDGDFRDALIEGAKIRFTLAGGANAGEVLIGEIQSVSYDGTADSTTLTFAFENEDSSGSATNLAGEAANLDGTGILLLPTVDAQLPDFGAIGSPDFSNFGIDEIILALQTLVDFLEGFESFGFLKEPLPVIGKSVADLIDLADDLKAFVDEFEANPSGSLQFVEDAINDALGFSSGVLHDLADDAGLSAAEIASLGGSLDDPFDLGLIYDDGGTSEVFTDDLWLLTFEFTIGTFFNEQLPVGFDLSDAFVDAGLPNGLGELFQLSGSANLEAQGGVLLQLGVGIDITTFVESLEPSGNTEFDEAVFLLDGTSLRANLSVGGSNLSFNGGLGPFTLSVRDDGAAHPAFIEIALGVAVDTDNDQFTATDLGTTGDVGDKRNVSIAQLLTGGLDTYFDINDGSGGESFGSVSGNLPIFAPTDSSYAGAIKIGENAGAGGGNLLNFLNPAFVTDGDVTVPIAADKFVVDVSEVYDFVTNFDPADLSLFDQIILAVDAFDGFLTLLQDDIFGAVSSLDIPLVGEAFADAAAFIRDFQADFVAPLRTAVETIKNAVDDFDDPDKNIISKLLFDLLGPSGLDLLVPLEGTYADDGITPGDFIGLDAGLMEQFINGEIDLADALIAWDFTIGDPIVRDGSGAITSDPIANPGIGFDLGIPGLGLETDGSLDIYLGWSLSLGFGLSGSEGFFFDVSAAEELSFEFVVRADAASITGTLGFLELSASAASRDIDGDGNDDVTEVTAKFGVNIREDGATGDDADRLAFTELGNVAFDIGAYARAAAVLDLNLGLSSDLVGSGFASGFPSVSAGFNFLWEIGDPDTLTPFEDLSFADSLQVVAFTDLGIDAGEFLSDVLKPLVDKIAEVTGPIQPIIDFLLTPVPVVSQLGLNVTILDLAASFGNVDAGLIKSIAEVITFINTLAGLPANSSLVIPLVGDGDKSTADYDDAFIIYIDDALAAGLGLTVPSGSVNPLTGDATTSEARSNLIGGQANLGSVDLFGKISNTSGGDATTRNALQSTARSSAGSGQGSDGEKILSLPWLEDPTEVFNLLLGDPLTLVEVDLKPLAVAFEWSQFFSIFGPLGVSINLIIEATADFAFGYDTQGIQDFVETDFQNFALILNGLFVSDLDEAGTDVPEVTLFGGITAAAELNLGIARGGVAGGLFIEILFDLFDPDDDGKVRIFELAQNFTNQLRAPGGEVALAPLAIFDVSGEIFARLFAFLKIDFGLFEVDKEFDIVPPITILEFDIDFFRPPVMATEQDNGDLVVNVGKFAEQRLLGNATDIAENIRIEKTGESGNFITVDIYSDDPSAYGDDAPTAANPFSYQVEKGKRLIVDGGNENDDIELIGFNGSEVEFIVEGGGGNDRIAFSGAPVGGGTGSYAGLHTILGGLGSDDITGSLGTDLIVGGAGDDTIAGDDGVNAGNDDIIFGDGYDVQDNVAIGAAGPNDGRDDITGGSGDNIIFGQGGADTITGSDARDLILADGGKLLFEAGQLPLFDNLLDIWNGATTETDLADVIFADTVDAMGGDDIVFAGAGNDSVEGGAGNDLIFAGAGSDEVTETSGVNIIFGDRGAMLGDFTGHVSDIEVLTDGDFLIQEALKDIVEISSPGLGAGNDTITGGSDEDLIFGGEGNDDIDGEGADDRILAGGGADTAFGGAGRDAIFGEGGNDFIRGEDGNDTLSGGSGPDEVYGDAGDDLLIGTKGSDALLAGVGDDTIKIYYQGGRTNSLFLVDGGEESGDSDKLFVFGTSRADEILLRANLAGDQGFIANILGELDVERVNYNDSVEQIVVNGGLGDDFFAVDDTAAVVTINGELGDDRFQVGQLYRTDRFGPETPEIAGDVNPVNGISDENAFRTIAVTRGYLSYGVSEAMTISGGLGNDDFTVFHNAAVLQLNGDDGDDTFTVRAFALVGSQEPLRERTDLSGGAGADLVRYAVNAPVNIDGGDGFDTLIVIGTEFGDDFVVTDEGVFGAGLNVNFLNIETLRVDGAEGNDRIFVQSTKETFLTEIFGGLGEDTFFMSGDTPPVVSNDLRGHSGIVAHEIESTLDGSAYHAQEVFGISANVADDEEPFAVIAPSLGSTAITEGDAVGDSYTVVLTRQPVKPVEVLVTAPLPTPDARQKGSHFFRVHSDTALATSADGQSVTLRFTTSNWSTPQTVNVVADSGDGVLGATPEADDADREDTGRNFTRDDTDPVQSPIFNYDDDAFEGTRSGIAIHKFESRDTIDGDASNFVGVDLTEPDAPVVTLDTSGGYTETTVDQLIGHRFKVVEGPAKLQERLIQDAAILDGNLVLTLESGYLGEAPDAASSTYQIIVDDAVRGLVSSDIEEVVGEEVFDDRTFVYVGADKTDETLIGRVFELIAGPGAGQSAMVLGVDVFFTDADGNAMGGAGWIELNAVFDNDPVAGETLYRMKLYDGLATQVVPVTIHDNDTPTLVPDQTAAHDNGTITDIEDITAVIEGGDGDQRGEWDVLKFSLNQQPSATVTVTITYDANELDLTLTGATESETGGVGTLVFDVAAGDWNVANEILVKATDDIQREGLHNSLISFAFSSADVDGTNSTTETIVVDPDVESASVGLSFAPSSVSSVSIEGIGAIANGDTVGGGSSEIIAYTFIANQVIFYDPRTTTDGKFDAGQSELVIVEADVEVSYDYTVPGFDGAFASSILVRLADDDAPTLLVRETGGSTNVIETDRYDDTGASVPSIATDSYELVLTSAPESGEVVTVYIDELITKTTKTGGIRHDEIQVVATSSDSRFDDTNGRAFVEFTDANWDDPITIEVAAVNDGFVDGGDTKVFAPGPAALSSILGPVVVDGAGGSGSLSGLDNPLMLPGETNVKAPTGDVVGIDNTAATLTVERSNIDNQVMHDLRLPGRIAADDMPAAGGIATNADLEALIDKTLEITRAPAAPSVTDQFRLIIDLLIDDMGTGDLSDDLITFVLNEPYTLATDENGNPIESFDPTQAEALGYPVDDDAQVNRYAITGESLNFFVEEEEQVDLMIVNDADSPADSSGTLTADRLYGLNMGPDVVIGGVLRQGGITYGNLEVLEVNLGTGYNDFDILGTTSREDGFKTWTIVNTGTEIDDPNRAGERIGDTVSVLVSEADIPTADGTGGLTAENPSIANDFQTVLTISGLSATDGALEGQTLTLANEDGGAVTTFERVIRTNTGNTLYLDSPLPEKEAGGIDVDAETEWSIVDRADGGLAIDLGGGDDVLNAGLGALSGRSADFDGAISDAPIVVFGGLGDDQITGGLGEDILFGDLGRVDHADDEGGIVTRLGETPEVITGELETTPVAAGATTLEVVAYDPSLPNEMGSILLPVADTSDWAGIADPSETADTGLTGLFVDINSGTGFRQEPRQIVANDDGSFTVANAFTEGFDATTRFRISTTPEDQTDGFGWGATRILAVAGEGGEDTILAGGGDDTVIGGEGDDVLMGEDGEDTVIGDLGVIESTRAIGAPSPTAGIYQSIPTRADSVRSIDVTSGGADTIEGGADGDVIIAGAGADTLSGNAGSDLVMGDSGFLDYVDGVLLVAETYPPAVSGAADTISGGGDDDTIFGGLGGDAISGDGGQDLILGDHGRVDYALDDDLAPTQSTVATVTSALDALGGDDYISGDDGEDTILGGTGGDAISGDGAEDLIHGDNGIITKDAGVFVQVVTTDDDTGAGATTGGVDTISGDAADDIVLGGTDGDRIAGGADNDLVLGDYGQIDFAGGVAVRAAVYVDGDFGQRLFGGNDVIYGDGDQDVLIGAAGSDLIDGDLGRDLIYGDNVVLDRQGAALGDYTDPRYRTLLAGAGMLYGTGVSATFGNGFADHTVLVDGTARTEPGQAAGPVWRNWNPEILDHTLAAETDASVRQDRGDDYIAGGGDEDLIFGQLGDDTIQGDGGIERLDRGAAGVGFARSGGVNGAAGTISDFVPSFETAEDADDYIEGNGGDDLIFGNLGQDDIVGDNSDLFSLGDTAEREPVGQDTIFGGSGLRIDRHDYVEDANGTADTVVIAPEDRHSQDADMILGDNGRIFRIVTGDGDYLSFRYDAVDDAATEHYGAGDAALNRSDADRPIVVRAADLIDYEIGGAAVGADTGLGAGDEIHGETGDDFLYGMVGDDILYGDAEDDDIIAGQGDDWVSGGTGLDGVIGGDGRIFTAKNSPTEGELLNGIGTVSEEFISTPGKIQQSTINVEGELRKIVDLSPFFPDETTVGSVVEDGSDDDDDIIFGGLGSDFLHGGFGDDAISGAEAMPGDATFSLNGTDYTFTDLLYSFDNPGNPGKILSFGLGTNRPTEFASYDEFNPRPLIFVDPSDNYQFTDPSISGAVPFVLNHLAGDGSATDMAGDGQPSDGDDRIFGDLGNDWVVGGTGRDNIYGGFGSDYLDADDDRATDQGTNQSPDSFESYADIAYGGAGRDWIVGNTGGDRLIDWVGEFNAYIVPFAPFGAFTVSRTVQPQIYDYLYDLSAADGADPTRDVDGTTARNGEPYGEIGAVKQQDPFWHDQTGAPDDPQAGNIPGGKRDVFAAEDFNSMSDAESGLLGFAADSGGWTTDAGRLVVSPDGVGSEAVSVYHVQNALPSYFEMVADIAAVKDRFGYDSNGFMIFDYYSPTDFKFAGINQNINKIQIGHRDATGWHVDVQSNKQLRADTFYHLLVAVNGTTVTALVDGSDFLSHTFAARLEDGIPQGINRGMIGFGANNSFTTVDNFAIRVLPPNLTYETHENFDDGAAQLFGIPVAGAWSVSGGAFSAGPDSSGAAINLLDLSSDLVSPDATMGANSKVRLSASIETDGQAGIVFDYVSQDRFKFATIDQATGEVVIGHYEARRGWVVDTTTTLTLGGGSHEMSVLLSGSTASVEVDGAFVLSHAFNAVTVDGQSGLLARSDATFDDVAYATDDTSLAMALRASSIGSGGEALQADDLDATMDEAIRRLAQGENLSASEIAMLSEIDVRIADLEGDRIARYDGSTITFDIDAAGHGYFVDETPEADEEFFEDGSALAGSFASGRIDLLTSAMHELGHALGFDHVATDGERSFMNGMLDPSQRLGLIDDDAIRTSTTDEVQTVVYDERTGEMVTEDEAMLLDALEATAPIATTPTPRAGKSKAVKWA